MTKNGRTPRLDVCSVAPVYAIADAGVLGLQAVPDALRRMVGAGIRWIQLRAKDAPDDELCDVLEACSRLLARASVKLWINDRPDLAVLYGAAGVHVGQGDLPPRAVRRIVEQQCWIGLSTHDLDQLAAADQDPAVDLVALGPIFPTPNKADPDPVVGLETLRRARRRTSKPLVAIGGISEESLPAVLAAGADAVAVLGAVCRGDIEANCTRLLRLAEQAR